MKREPDGRMRKNPALSTPKKRSGVKKKNSSRPGKLKRMRMRRLKVSGAGSTAEEPAGILESAYSWFLRSQE